MKRKNDSDDLTAAQIMAGWWSDNMDAAGCMISGIIGMSIVAVTIMFIVDMVIG